MKPGRTIFRSLSRQAAATLLLVCCLQARAQFPDYHLQSYGYTYGIRPGFISNAIRDKNGFLWIQYPRSVQRFDGKQIRNFSVDGTLNSIFCDSEGQVWVTSHNAVLRFANEVRGFRKVAVLPDRLMNMVRPGFKQASVALIY